MQAISRPIRVIALLLAALPAASCGSDGTPVGPVERYVNPRYAYQVDYPEGLDLREYDPDDVAIGRAAGDGFAARVELVLETGEAESFESFVMERARLACAADEPELTLRCTEIEKRGTVRSESGLRGEILQLRWERAGGGGEPLIEVGERGPFVAFDFTRKLRAEGFAVLFVRAPVSLQQWEADPELVLQIARSLDDYDRDDE